VGRWEKTAGRKRVVEVIRVVIVVIVAGVVWVVLIDG
jgi:hypothetical protein